MHKTYMQMQIHALTAKERKKTKIVSCKLKRINVLLSLHFLINMFWCSLTKWMIVRHHYFTLRFLADTFIRSSLQWCICVFRWGRTKELCVANTMSYQLSYKSINLWSKSQLMFSYVYGIIYLNNLFFYCYPKTLDFWVLALMRCNMLWCVSREITNISNG